MIKSSSSGRDRDSRADNDDTTQGDSLLSLLAAEWSPKLLSTCHDDGGHCDKISDSAQIQSAVRRTIPLLSGSGDAKGGGGEASTVPFLCRYRTDIVQPLTTRQVHALREFVDKHEALTSLRLRALAALDERYNTSQGRNYHVSAKVKQARKKRDENTAKSSREEEYEEIKRRMLTCIAKSELDELYAPYKPPTKGSVLERIASSHPDIVDSVEQFWAASTDTDNENAAADDRTMQRILRKNESNKHDDRDEKRVMTNRECAIYLLGSKIASNPHVGDVVVDIVRKECTVVTSSANKDTTKRRKNKSDEKRPPPKSNDKRSKYEQYFDFSSRATCLRDHQALAIRRGVSTKELSMSLRVPDHDFIKRRIRSALLDRVLSPGIVNRYRQSGFIREILSDSIDDAWTRLLRRRSTTLIWKEKIAEAERRGITVFSDNVCNALLAPPLKHPSCVMAVDPGHKAGIKIALLNPRGELVDHHTRALSTVHYLDGKRESALSELGKLLGNLRGCIDKEKASASSLAKGTGISTTQSASSKETRAVVALGNGHGSEDSRSLIMEASRQTHIPVDLHLVDEAGASVWSVTPAAEREFPDIPPASIGAVSIGRRVQDPMNELVKVPPRSLGLGMYQHDLPEKDLEESLKHATIDAVAFVGVDGNACSLELLRNVPGLSKKHLAERIIAARPIRSREDLRKVSGLGPKTFENCAAFVRIHPKDATREILDSTRVHPESYPLVYWLMKRLKCALRELPEKLDGRKEKDKVHDGPLVQKAAKAFAISPARVLNIMELLIDSLRGDDPRIVRAESRTGNSAETDTMEQCSRLPSALATSMAALQKACPVRFILGTVRNVTDFGAFVDFGGESDGLLHVSKLGSTGLNDLHVGKRIGVDVLAVETETNRVSLGLAGFGLEASFDSQSSRKRKPPNAKSRAGTKRRRT